jgi:hypothetical protein
MRPKLVNEYQYAQNRRVDCEAKKRFFPYNFEHKPHREKAHYCGG